MPRQHLQRGLRFAAAVLLTSVLCVPVHASRDVVMVLDNSGSMRQNDPARLGVASVARFLQAQPFDTRVSIVLFDTAPAVVLPLSSSDGDAASQLQSALSRLTYRGQWTQTAAAVERAIYELQNEGRPEAEKAIVLVTDGLIDTGDPQRDAEARRWLQEDLSAVAAKAGIRIFGIAFTEQADFMLLQSVAQRTGAEYYRALSTDELDRALLRLEAKLAETAKVAPAAKRAERRQPDPGAEIAKGDVAPDAVVETQKAEGAPQDEPLSPKFGWSWQVAVALAAILAALAVLMWLARRPLHSLWSRLWHHSGSAQDGPMAILYDIADPSTPSLVEIRHRPLVIGRKQGSDTKRDYLVLAEKTVGRWHATVERRGQAFWLRDEASANGTFLNGKRLQGEHVLKHGDSILVHKHPFEFVIPDLMNSDQTVMSPVPMGSGRN